MKSNTQRNDNQTSCVSQQRNLSFYEEHYILEPEDYDQDNGFLQYESDDSLVYLEENY